MAFNCDQERYERTSRAAPNEGHPGTRLAILGASRGILIAISYGALELVPVVDRVFLPRNHRSRAKQHLAIGVWHLAICVDRESDGPNANCQVLNASPPVYCPLRCLPLRP